MKALESLFLGQDRRKFYENYEKSKSAKNPQLRYAVCNACYSRCCFGAYGKYVPENWQNARANERDVRGNCTDAGRK